MITRLKIKYSNLQILQSDVENIDKNLLFDVKEFLKLKLKTFYGFRAENFDGY